ncbi:GNAT family N-acetyltransferase [Cellulomonas endophytica]|uniref:GNAT family N-acetyltransferase n=1 Tax=Cellulomonas endophytica TaxID=2494735 RepID=UPI001013BEA9|nr:N-acetyltransferase [Cellulomonas endophytica]
MRIREATDHDLPVLRDMLLEAYNWTGERRFTPQQLLRDEHAGRYLSGWRRVGDFGFVALDPSASDDAALGAVWARPLPAAAAGYGYVADDVPEISMAVVAHARGRGIGAALLSACLDGGRARGWRALSLSVEDGNTAARHLYERHGFTPVGRTGGSDTLVVEL